MALPAKYQITPDQKRERDQGVTKPLQKVWRDRISNSKILERLIKHAEGRPIKMSGTQAKVGLALISKVLPDLQAIEYRGEVELNIVQAEPVTPSDWLSKHGSDTDIADGELIEQPPVQALTGPSIALEPGDWFSIEVGQTQSKSVDKSVETQAVLVDNSVPPL